MIKRISQDEDLLNHYKSLFQLAHPIPHVIIESFLDTDIADKLHAYFPRPGDDWYKYENHFEKKHATDRLKKLPFIFTEFFNFMNSQYFLPVLEKITGIDGLIPDPWLRGGGLHAHFRGQKLDLHRDFTLHPKLQVYRRINLLIYLNKDWSPTFGGDLELWPDDMKSSKIIMPSFNRCVIFDTLHAGYHGLPEPINCPEDTFRKSLALYYYTAKHPDPEHFENHSTRFVARPGDKTDEEIERLRQLRNKGRLASNI